MGRHRTWLVACMGAAVLAGGEVMAAEDQADGDADLRARVRELEARLAAMQQETGDQWLTEQRAAEIRALVQDVLHDADTRASLLQGGMAAGHDGNFFLASADGNFRLEIAGQMQFRWVLNYQDDDDTGAIDTTRHGFEMRRTKLNFSGHIIDPSWQYVVQGAFDRDGGTFDLEDFEITKDFDNGWTVTFGQFKPPFMREELTSSKRQLAVDRSLVNEEYNQDRGQGIQVAFETEQFRVAAMYHDGFGSDNIPALAEDTEWGALTARAEVLIAGDWRQFRDFTSWADDEFGALIGAAVHYEEMESGTPSGPEEELFTWTIDGSLEFGGANAFAAVVGRHLEELDLDQFGVVVQGGIFVVPDEWEIFARYEWSDFDVDVFEDLSVITFGVNKYFDKHNLKWTTDIGIGLDEVASPFASSGVGWREDLPDQDTQFVLRSQLQLLF